MPDITTLGSQLQNEDGVEELAAQNAIPGHPLGVKPSGNALLAAVNLRNAIGTFGLLPDELILILLEFLDCPSLLRLGRTCKALYAFTRAEDLWKTIFIRYGV
jgi:hypothetical protein